MRETYKRFPSWTQPFWTLLTGKPLPKESPLLEMSPLLMLMVTFFVLLTVVVLHILLLNSEGFFWIIGLIFTPLEATLVSGALRKIQVVYVHHCVHNTFFKEKRMQIDYLLNF